MWLEEMPVATPRNGKDVNTSMRGLSIALRNSNGCQPLSKVDPPPPFKPCETWPEPLGVNG